MNSKSSKLATSNSQSSCRCTLFQNYDAPETMLTCWCIGQNESGQFGIGNKNAQKQLMKCGWSEKIQIRNIYAANQYTLVEDIHGNYYSAGWNGSGACTVNDKSKYILNMTPITYFK
eukprot:975644_1